MSRKPDIIMWGLLLLLPMVMVIKAVFYYQDSRSPLIVTTGAEEGTDSGEPAGYDFSIADRINPNTATEASLMRLPGIGPARAQAIIAYRQQWRQNHPEAPGAFTRKEDLSQIKGIGPATVEKMSAYLVFE